MRSLHLFAGGGGGLLADLILGHRPTVAVEIEPNARAVLEARRADGWFPDLVEIHDDITTFDATRWRGRVDLVAAGFPCQDISLAGKGRGLDGERSGLFFEAMRVVRDVRPRFVFLENSPAITVRGLGRVLGELAELGFDAEWTCLPASAVGAPHRRNRWWLLARMADADAGLGDDAHEAVCAGRDAVDGRGADGADADSRRREEQRQPQHRDEQRARGHESDRLRARGRGQGAAVADTCREQCEDHEAAISRTTTDDLPADADRAGRAQQRCAVAAPAARDVAECDRGQAKPGVGRGADGLAQWLDETRAGYWTGDWERGVPRVVDGEPGRVARLKQLGNGQVPQCAAAAFEILMQRLEDRT